jgi:hypothetical protein
MGGGGEKKDNNESRACQGALKQTV